MNKRMLLIPAAMLAVGLGVVAMVQAEDKPEAPASAPATTAPSTQASAKISNTKCPVSGDAVDPKCKTVEYNGKTIGFCCEDCVEPFKKNPENGPAPALKASLMARWREPNLTIHRYKVSGPDGSLVSSHASANISLRLVPGQEVDSVVRQRNGKAGEDAAVAADCHLVQRRRRIFWYGRHGGYRCGPTLSAARAIAQVWALVSHGESSAPMQKQILIQLLICLLK